MDKLSLNEVIETAVQIEKSGYSYYESALSRKDLSIKARELLSFLKDEELNHEKTFLSLRDSQAELELEESQDWTTVSSYLKAIIESRLFNSPDSAIQLVSDSKNEKEILKKALTFEKDTILYFHGINDVVTDEKTKKIIRLIINEEVSHFIKLSRMLDDI